jgi:hypothetical protein
MMTAGENSSLVRHCPLAILPAVFWEQIGGMDERSENVAFQAFRSHLQVIFKRLKILRESGVLWDRIQYGVVRLHDRRVILSVE